jgi:hypothetical protein
MLPINLRLRPTGRSIANLFSTQQSATQFSMRTCDAHSSANRQAVCQHNSQLPTAPALPAFSSMITELAANQLSQHAHQHIQPLHFTVALWRILRHNRCTCNHGTPAAVLTTVQLTKTLINFYIYMLVLQLLLHDNLTVYHKYHKCTLPGQYGYKVTSIVKKNIKHTIMNHLKLQV